MAPLSCLAGPDKQSRSKTDVRSALDTLSALDAIFSDSGYESGSVSDDEDDDDGQLPPEHYLALAESLDIAQLRQKRYSPRTQEKLDETRGYWERYCRHIKANAERQWDRISNSEETVRFLYAFFSWRCDIRRGKNNRNCPGIKRKSSLETFWKWWHLVLKQETASGLSKDTIVKVEDVVAQVATEKELALVGRPKKNMYIEDVAEFAQVVLTTTEMTFVCGWQRIQMLLFLQLAAITASRPSAILHLRYRDVVLTLIRVPDGGRPRLFIFLKPEFTKRFLGDKAPNEFKIPEIIFDPTLVLSPHICLLTLLFHIGGFKSISTSGPVLDCAEKLYSAKVLDGKGQQPLLLKDELLDKFVFCQAEPTSTGFKICLDQRMTPSMVSSRMRRAGEITGFEEVAHPYNLRYAGAKAFNNSEEVTEALQNVMLQHADIRTFVKHYQVDVDVDAQGIVRKTGSQTALVQFACSMSASIDPNRPYKLSPEESRSLNYLPVVRGRQDTVQKRKREWEDREAELERANRVCKTSLGHLDDRVLAESNPEVLERLEVFHDRTAEAKSEHNKATRELRNEKQRQRNRQIRENLERYKNEQPVIDLERQLAGKLVDTKVMDTFEHEAFMPPEHLMFVDCVLTMPGANLEAEYQRRINTINAGVAFCGVEEGRPSRRPTQTRGRPTVDDDPCPPTKRQRCSVKDNTEVLLHQAMESVQAKSTAEQPQTCFRPRVCFLCVGNPSCTLEDRIMKYATSGSLTRHFLRRHINPLWPATGVECNVCEGKVLPAKSALLSHAEEAHGTVVRGRAREKLALEYQRSLEN
ncbi:conserved hypothetical protein [Histoplasma mississippiense (nom. inval.)]|uniref:conserved hypothetical protein n=1 Tax=Ajellomyces capsulatus (strain NAm1 / WU24) TaxID=2059318 RepID=UPI000157B8BE|nr:conserved hypothetical protein [Histoplasma mississippiense (nom. inval.)]EDN03747.1 conserved hypothetical protein [Histoplasma mississippiense (nom. inval.)]